MGGFTMNDAGLAAPGSGGQKVKQVARPLAKVNLPRCVPAAGPFYNQDDRVSDAVIEGV